MARLRIGDSYLRIGTGYVSIGPNVPFGLVRYTRLIDAGTSVDLPFSIADAGGTPSFWLVFIFGLTDTQLSGAFSFTQGAGSYAVVEDTDSNVPTGFDPGDSNPSGGGSTLIRVDVSSYPATLHFDVTDGTYEALICAVFGSTLVQVRGADLAAFADNNNEGVDWATSAPAAPWELALSVVDASPATMPAAGRSLYFLVPPSTPADQTAALSPTIALEVG